MARQISLSKARYFKKKNMKKTLLLFIGLIAFSALAQDSLGVNKLSQYSYFDAVNDVWGWDDGNGREFALVGLNSGLSIVEVTNPAQPVEKHFISGANSTWRDIKTWKNYAYVIHDSYSGGASDGILIVDMNTVDSATISFSNYFPMVLVDTNFYFFDKAHNLYMDESGILYVFGSNAGIGGALMFDADSNATTPVYLGAYNGSYFHDGVARGDTLWGGAIYKGGFEVVDVSNKANPQIMASQITPNAFCHNIWFSDDNQTVFTTDEKTGAFVVAYDVSDLSNITELDRIRTGIFDPTKVIPHNTHVYGDFLVTSYYTSGLQIVDASRPDILVETAYYDTSPFSGDGFDGAWGAFPYLPSGNILVSDRQEGLFVLSTNYPRASFFTAFVKDSITGSPVVNADIEMLNSDIAGPSNIFGNFRDGQADSGVYQVVVTKTGYITDTITVNMQAGLVAAETIALLPIGFSINESAGIFELNAYPNPSGGSFIVDLPGSGNINLSLKVFNTAGENVQNSKVSMASGSAEVSTNLPAGIYLFRLAEDEVFVGSFRMVIE